MLKWMVVLRFSKLNESVKKTNPILLMHIFYKVKVLLV